MAIKLLVRQGGAAAAQPDLANLDDGREGVPVFEGNTPLVTMAQRWEQGTAGTGSFTYVDREGLLPYKFRPHAEVKLVEDAGGSDIYLGWGRIEGGNDVGRISATIAGDEVQHNRIQVMDCNMDLRGLPFRNGWSRPAENSWVRLQALEAAKLNGSSSTETLRRATTDIQVQNFANNHLVDANDPVDLEAVDYPPGTTVEEVLVDIMENWGRSWGVTIHHVAGASHKCLLVQDLEDLASFTSALRISDDPADWDPDDTTAPTVPPHWKRGDGKTSDNSATISGLISIWGGNDTEEEERHLYVETGEAPTDWETWVDVYHDDLAQSAVQAERRANHILNDRKRPYITHQPSILLNPDQVTLITAGQAIETKSVVLNQGPDKDEFVWRRIVEILWEPVHDGRWWAHLSLERPRNTRARAGGGTGPTPPLPPTPGTTTTVAGGGNVDNDAEQGVTVPASTGGLVAVLLTNAVATPTPAYRPTTAGTPEPMTVIGSITHPTPASGSNRDGESLFVAYLANPTTSGSGAHVDWGTAAGSQFGSLKGYWTTPGTATPTAIMNSGTGSTASVTPTGAGAEDMVMHCAGWRIWSLGNVSQTPVDLSSVTDDWALPFNNSAGQNDGCWFGGHLAGGGTRSVNVVTSTPWVAAAIILGGVGAVAGDSTEPVGETGEGSVGSGSTFSPINHIHEHGLLSDDELHYHDTSQIEGTVSFFPIDDLTDVNAPTPADQDVLTWDDTASEWVPAAGGGSVAELDDVGDVNAPSPANGDVLTWDSTPGEWVSAAGGSVSLGAWTSYTPTWTADTTNPTLGSTVVSGRYKMLDPSTAIVQVYIDYNTGGGFNVGNGNYSLSLPGGMTADTNLLWQVGSAWYLDSGTTHFAGTCKVGSGATIIQDVIFADTTASKLWSSTRPTAAATGDGFGLSIVLEVQ